MNKFDLDAYREKIKDLSENKLSFGNAYMDDSCSGILRNDMIIVAAPSGTGKTEQATAIGLHNAMLGKKVYMFSLESFEYEIEARNIYRIAMKNYYEQKKEYIYFNFQNYIDNKIPDTLKPYIEGAENCMRVLSDNFHVIYGLKDYTIKKFEEQLTQIDFDAELIIIDHLHYFDINGVNENVEITKIVKKIRDLVQISDIPIILVSHIRKSNNLRTKIAPSQDDLHGTSNIYKNATKIITIAPDFTREVKASYKFPTWIRVSKNRYNGSVTRYCASLDYDIRKNCYSGGYFLYKLNFEETEAKIIESNFPDWSKNRTMIKDNWSIS